MSKVMKIEKGLMIAAEVSALICLMLLLYIRAKSGTFDNCDALVCGMFAVSAVICQSIQQSIKRE